MSATLTAPADATQIVFNHETRIVTDGPASTQLSRRQAAVFGFLVARYPCVASADAILAAVYADSAPETGKYVIHVHLCRLRRCLREAAIRDCITGIWGAGWHLAEPVALVPGTKSRQVVFEGAAITRLRELLRRCADRPADAGLAEQVRAAAVWA